MGPRFAAVEWRKRATWRRVLRMCAAPWYLRRCLSSPHMTSRRQWVPFSMFQCERTLEAKRFGGTSVEARLLIKYLTVGVDSGRSKRMVSALRMHWA